MSIMPSPRKRSAELTEIVQGVRLSVEVLYVKATTKRLITLDRTERGVYVTYQLVSSLAALIAKGNPNVPK